MTRWLVRLLLAGVVAWLAAALPARADTPAEADAADRQVLVLLRLPPEHFRASSAYGGGYGDAGRAARRRIAIRIAQDHGLTLVTDWPMPLVGLDCFVMRVPDSEAPAEAAARLSRDRQVAWSEPMHAYQAQASAAPPNDPLFRLQPAAQEWRLAELHAVATGRNVRVAVVDSTVDATHPDLAGQIVARQNFVTGRPGGPEGHGTAVAGVIAAVADNEIGVAGVAPGARLMALRACWQKDATATVCDTLSLAKALHYAIDNDAQVINLSLAGPPDLLLGRLIDAALAHRIVVVGAADPKLARGGFPASHPGVVSVASEAGGGGAAYVAPGRGVPTTLPGGRWSLVDGSSYSAAHVSGLFALVRERARRGGAAATLAAGAGGAVDACATLRADRGTCGKSAALSANTRR